MRYPERPKFARKQSTALKYIIMRSFADELDTRAAVESAATGYGADLSTIVDPNELQARYGVNSPDELLAGVRPESQIELDWAGATDPAEGPLTMVRLENGEYVLEDEALARAVEAEENYLGIRNVQDQRFSDASHFTTHTEKTMSAAGTAADMGDGQRMAGLHSEGASAALAADMSADSHDADIPVEAAALSEHEDMQTVLDGMQDGTIEEIVIEEGPETPVYEPSDRDMAALNSWEPPSPGP